MKMAAATRRVLVVLAVAAWALTLGCPAAADDGAILAVGGNVTPIVEHTSIEMTSEYVHAWVSPESVRVECVFFLRNRGQATRVTMGFPCESEGADVSGVVPFRWFRSWVDGVPTAAPMVVDTVESAHEWARRWYVKEVEFAAGQTRCVRDEYAAELGSSVGDYSFFEYILRTGATWAGRIGVADIVVTTTRMAGMDLKNVEPAATGRDEHEVRWHFSDIEPGQAGAPRRVTVGWQSRSATDGKGER